MDAWASKQILLGVSGSIAAYKAADLCSRLGKGGGDVHVVATANALRFVGEATFRALTRNPVLSDTFDEPVARRIAHIDLAQSADLVVVAPASANLIAKAALGLADDMLTSCLLAVPRTTPLLIAPAMNTVMWEHAATQANIRLLRERGAVIVEPGTGLLACLDEGQGKLADIELIVHEIAARLSARHDLEGVHVLITAGATREPIDPVRFISNRSSGKMGFALAEAAAARGARVTLVAGHADVRPPSGVEKVQVATAGEMLAACREHYRNAQVLIAAAAVADYAPEQVAEQKIKKPDDPFAPDTRSLALKRTPDILATLAADRQPGQIAVGFAAETEDVYANAQRKLNAKRLDLIAANDVSAADAGFEVDTNRVSLFWPGGRREDLPLLSKRETAERILDAVVELVANARISTES